MTSLVEVNQAIISLVVFDHHLSTTPEYEKLIIDIHADEAYNEIRDVISNNGQKYRWTDRRRNRRRNRRTTDGRKLNIGFIKSNL